MQLFKAKMVNNVGDVLEVEQVPPAGYTRHRTREQLESLSIYRVTGKSLPTGYMIYPTKCSALDACEAKGYKDMDEVVEVMTSDKMTDVNTMTDLINANASLSKLNADLIELLQSNNIELPEALASAIKKQ